MNDKVLVVKLNNIVSGSHIDSIHKAILTQMEGGVVVLPYGCEAIVVPKDIEVKVNKLVPEVWLPGVPDKELYDWVLCRTSLGLPHIGEFRNGKWWFMDCDLGPAEEILNLTVTGWMPIPEDEK